ncbi:transmembrane and coiled-coil domains-containing protein 7 [Entophlyctis luteolus]|nr:transmembrane and coiled-coil domains-containing protein 7 [Entophlyctis luteolus]
MELCVELARPLPPSTAADFDLCLAERLGAASGLAPHLADKAAVRFPSSKAAYVATCLYALCQWDTVVASTADSLTAPSSIASYKTVSVLMEICVSWGFAWDDSLDSQLFALECCMMLTQGMLKPNSKSTWIKHFVINKYLPALCTCLISLSTLGPLNTAATIPIPTFDVTGILDGRFKLKNDRPHSAAFAVLTNMLSAAISPTTSMRVVLQLMASAQRAVPTDKFQSVCGAVLSVLLLQPQGVKALLQETLSLDGEDEDSAAVAEGISATAMRGLAGTVKVLGAVSRRSGSADAYFSAIGAQLLGILREASSDGKNADIKKLHAATVYVVIQLTNQRPQYSKRHIHDIALAPFRRAFGGSRPQETAMHDLDGNVVVASEREIADSFIPLYCLYEFQASNNLVAKQSNIMEMLKSLVRMTPLPKLATLVSGLVLFDGANAGGLVPFLRLGPSGGVVFVLRRDENLLIVNNPDAFVEFLLCMDQPELTTEVFLSLLEFYARSDSSAVRDTATDSFGLAEDPRNLVVAQILLSLINRFGASLVKGATKIVDLVKRIVVDTNVDAGCMLLCLTILKGIFASADPNDDIKQRFGLADFTVVLQALEQHKDGGISTVARDVRLLISSRSQQQSDGTALDANTISSKRQFAESMLELSDELLPVRAHGIDEIRKMILRKDPVARENLTTILCAFLDMVQDEDSFIYLHAISGLAALTDSFPQETITQIMVQYVDTSLSMDYRLRIGQVALHTIQRMGAILFVHRATTTPIMTSILRVAVGIGENAGARGENSVAAELRNSATVLLSEIAQTAPRALIPVFEEVMRHVEDVLKVAPFGGKTADDWRAARGAAVLVLAGIVRAIAEDLRIVRQGDGGFPKGTMKRVYERLKIVNEGDTDELVRHNAGVALGDLKDLLAGSLDAR